MTRKNQPPADSAELPTISEPELMFCREYVRDRNATRAALEAGVTKNYNSASVIGHNLLRNVKIKAWISHLLQEQAKLLKIDMPKLLREYALIAMSDQDNYEVFRDRVTTRAGVPKMYTRAVRKVKLTRTERLTKDAEVYEVETRAEIELYDKLQALDKLMQHFKELGAGSTTDEKDKLIHALLTQLATTLAQQPAEQPTGADDSSGEVSPPVDA